MKEKVYCVEVGVLLNENNNEFDCYHIKDFYEEYSFYDENRLVYFSKEEAINYVVEYVKEGVNNTYGFVFEEIFNLTDEDKEEINDFHYCDICLVNPTKDSLLFFKKKDITGQEIVIYE